MNLELVFSGWFWQQQTWRVLAAATRRDHLLPSRHEWLADTGQDARKPSYLGRQARDKLSLTLQETGMRIAVQHFTTRDKAKKIVEQRLRNAEKQYGSAASDLEYEWHGYTLHVSAKAKGMHLKGTLEVTDTDVIVDGKLPLLAKPFESRIRHAVEREAESMFRTA